MLLFTFLATDLFTVIFFVSQLLYSISTFGERYQKLTFFFTGGMVYSQSYLKMPDGRLNETENKRVTQISGLKSGRGRE